MGLPTFIIDFQTKAIEAIGLASRGFVALVIKDGTATAGKTKVYKNFAEVIQSDYNAENYKLMKQIFDGKPSRVKVITVATEDTFTDAKDLILQGNPDIDYLVAPEFTDDNTAIISWIGNERDLGAKIKGVLVANGSDKEYIIDVKVVGAEDEFGSALNNQEARVAGIVAGLDPTRSATYYVIPEVKSIHDPVDPDAEINAGLLIYINDGAKVKIARGVNSFISTTPSKGALFTKIKNVETMDMLAYTIRQVVRDTYVGKFTNSLDNKNIILTAVNQLLATMADADYLNPSFNNECKLNLQEHLDYAERNGVDTTGFTETQIKKIDTGDNLYLTIDCRLLDTIENVKINVYI